MYCWTNWFEQQLLSLKHTSTYAIHISWTLYTKKSMLQPGPGHLIIIVTVCFCYCMELVFCTMFANSIALLNEWVRSITLNSNTSSIYEVHFSWNFVPMYYHGWFCNNMNWLPFKWPPNCFWMLFVNSKSLKFDGIWCQTSLLLKHLDA